MLRLRSLSTCAVFSLALAYGTPALAQLPSQSEATARADALFKEGQGLLQAGKISDACKRFTESWFIERSLGTLLNLAYCHENEGRTATAYAEFHEGAAEAAQRNDTARQQFANEQAAGLEKRLSLIKLAPGVGQAVLEVKVDGTTVRKAKDGRLGLQGDELTFAADPGAHAVVMLLANNRSVTKSVTVPAQAGTQTVALPADAESTPALVAPPIHVTPAPVTEPPPPVSLPPSPAPDTVSTDDKSGRRLAGFVIAGVGVVGLGVGTAFGLMTFSQKDKAASNGCDGGSHTCPPIPSNALGDAKDAISSARTDATISTIGFGVGVVGVAVGTYLILTSSSSGASSTTAARATPAFAPHFSPMLGGGVSGLRVDAVW